MACQHGDGSGGLAGARDTREPRAAPEGGAASESGCKPDGSLVVESWARYYFMTQIPITLAICIGKLFHMGLRLEDGYVCRMCVYVCV